MKAARWPWGIGLDKRQARRLRRRIAANLRVPSRAAIDCVVGGCCGSCGEGTPTGECPKSKRPCGHHCNHVWIHDACDWCGIEFLGDGEIAFTAGVDAGMAATFSVFHRRGWISIPGAGVDR